MAMCIWFLSEVLRNEQYHGHAIAVDLIACIAYVGVVLLTIGIFVWKFALAHPACLIRLRVRNAGQVRLNGDLGKQCDETRPVAHSETCVARRPVVGGPGCARVAG